MFIPRALVVAEHTGRPSAGLRLKGGAAARLDPARIPDDQRKYGPAHARFLLGLGEAGALAARGVGTQTFDGERAAQCALAADLYARRSRIPRGRDSDGFAYRCPRGATMRRGIRTRSTARRQGQAASCGSMIRQTERRHGAVSAVNSRVAATTHGRQAARDTASSREYGLRGPSLT